MSDFSGRISAYWLLALQFLMHWLRRPFVRQAAATAQVLAQFEREGLAPVPADARLNLADWQRCTGCGACDGVVPAGMRAPSGVMLSLGRKSQDAPAALQIITPYRPYAAAIAASCPEKIDVPALFAHIERSV